MKGLSGKSVLVTGGGGAIGAAICRRFAERRLCCAVIRDIEDQRLASNRRSYLLGILCVSVSHQKLGAFLCEASADRCSDSAAAAGHEHRLARESLHLGLPLSSLVACR